MAATVAHDDAARFLILANEPDTEAAQTGQQNLNNPAYAAQMIAGRDRRRAGPEPFPAPPVRRRLWHLAATQRLVQPGGLYLRLHCPAPELYRSASYSGQHSRNTSYIGNSLTVASAAAAAGMPVAIGQAWLDEGSRPLNRYSRRRRDPGTLSFQLLGSSGHLFPADPAISRELYADGYTWRRTMPFLLLRVPDIRRNHNNGGAANCTCTTASCSDYDIMQTENTLATAANRHCRVHHHRF